jgi:hypothetical protein
MEDMRSVEIYQNTRPDVSKHFRMQGPVSLKTQSIPHRQHITDPSRLRLFRERVAVYCENHTTQAHSVGSMQRFRVLKQVAHIVTTGL